MFLAVRLLTREGVNHGRRCRIEGAVTPSLSLLVSLRGSRVQSLDFIRRCIRRHALHIPSSFSSSTSSTGAPLGSADGLDAGLPLSVLLHVYAGMCGEATQYVGRQLFVTQFVDWAIQHVGQQLFGEQLEDGIFQQGFQQLVGNKVLS